MTYLYIALDIVSISLPLLFSFHPKLKFYTYWKALFLSIGIMMLIFIPWDVLFTINGIWGFNETYFSGIKILTLPLEEWLFFICIPFACVFTHYSLLYFFPKLGLAQKNTTILTHVLLALLVLMAFLYYDKWYTVLNFAYAILLLLIVMLYDYSILRRFYVTFLVMLVPFFIVNGILTGSLIEQEVVWYNNNENIGLRIGTIPVEDVVYAFTMILTVLALTDYFYKKCNRKKQNKKNRTI